MKAATLEKALAQLGWTFILAGFFQLSVDGRSILLPFFGAGLVVALARLGRYPALSSGASFAKARVCAVVGTALASIALIPSVDPRTPATLSMAATMVGSTAYAGAIDQWSVRQGWMPPARKASAATRWLAAATATFAVGLVVVVLTVEPLAREADATPPITGFLGRPFDGWAAELVVLAAFVVWVIGLAKLHGASKLIRHSLRAQPEAELVSL